MEYRLNVNLPNNTVVNNILLKLDAVTPFVYIPTSFGAAKSTSTLTRDYALSEETYDATKLAAISANAPVLSVVGDITANRFTFVTVIASYIHKVEAYVYYDTVENVLFYMPDPNMIEDGLEIYGNIIGGEASFSVVSDPSAYISTPAPTIKGNPTITISLISRGLEHQGANSFEATVTTGYVVTNNKSSITEYVSLTPALAYTSDIYYKTINMISPATRKMSNIKYGKPTEILIPITF